MKNDNYAPCVQKCKNCGEKFDTYFNLKTGKKIAEFCNEQCVVAYFHNTEKTKNETK